MKINAYNTYLKNSVCLINTNFKLTKLNEYNCIAHYNSLHRSNRSSKKKQKKKTSPILFKFPSKLQCVSIHNNRTMNLKQLKRIQSTLLIVTFLMDFDAVITHSIWRMQPLNEDTAVCEENCVFTSAEKWLWSDHVWPSTSSVATYHYASKAYNYIFLSLGWFKCAAS